MLPAIAAPPAPVTLGTTFTVAVSYPSFAMVTINAPLRGNWKVAGLERVPKTGLGGLLVFGSG